MRASKGRSRQRWGGPSEVTLELGLKQEGEAATGSAGTSVFEGPRAGRALASGIREGRPVR